MGVSLNGELISGGQVQLCGTDNAPTTRVADGAAPPKGPQCGSGSSVANQWMALRGPSPPAFPYRLKRRTKTNQDCCA